MGEKIFWCIMNFREVTAFIVFSITILPKVSAFENGNQEENNLKTADGSFAVIELFTSEGCSSCPPADWLLSDLVDEARKQDKSIFALAFHVDYWNYLGWKHIESEAARSDRQRQPMSWRPIAYILLNDCKCTRVVIGLIDLLCHRYPFLV